MAHTPRVRRPARADGRPAGSAAALAVVLGLAACSGDPGRREAARPEPLAAKPHAWLTAMPTHLQVHIRDLARCREPSGPARRVVVRLGPKPAGRVAIPCTTVVRAPPRVFTVELPGLPAGSHRLVIELPATGQRQSLTLKLPQVAEQADDAGFDMLAEHVWVDITARGIRIEGPTGPRKSL